MIDSTHICSKEDLYQQLHTFLHFPDYFGYNLDALSDILEEISEPITLTILNIKNLEQNLGISFCERFLQLFRDNDVPILLS